MMSDIWLALWFFVPAGLANIAPVFLSRTPGLRNWNTPLDFGKSYNGKRIFGEHKTWRGLIGGVVIGAATGGSLVYQLYPESAERVDIFPGSPLASMVFLGAILGFGALYGDAVESFFKRQINIAEGNSWFPFDQLDYIIGGLLASLPLVVLQWNEYFVIVVIWFLMHLTVSYIGYLLHFKKTPL